MATMIAALVFALVILGGLGPVAAQKPADPKPGAPAEKPKAPAEKPPAAAPRAPAPGGSPSAAPQTLRPTAPGPALRPQILADGTWRYSVSRGGGSIDGRPGSALIYRDAAGTPLPVRTPIPARTPRFGIDKAGNFSQQLFELQMGKVGEIMGQLENLQFSMETFEALLKSLRTDNFDLYLGSFTTNDGSRVDVYFSMGSPGEDWTKVTRIRTNADGTTTTKESKKKKGDGGGDSTGSTGDSSKKKKGIVDVIWAWDLAGGPATFPQLIDQELSRGLQQPLQQTTPQK